jgi:glucose/mannose-6-phosphate isomerase
LETETSELKNAMDITNNRLSEIDKDNMWDNLTRFPSHWREAMEFTRDVDWAVDKSKIRNICFSGMGGSAIGADLITAYTLNECSIPVYVNRNYDIPGWVNENTLFVACSFSGNTEETLSALALAHDKGAQIVAVTSGGKLLVEASRQGYGYVKIPGGMPPRAALAYSFVPLYRLFEYMGYISEGAKVLDETAELLEEQAAYFSDVEDNQALNIARDIQDTLPIVYTTSGLLEPVGLRWRCQFEENSKILSYGHTVPEMNHNEIVGWEQTAHLTGRLSVILLEDREAHEKVKQRLKIVRDLISDLAVSSHLLKTTGQSRLTRMFSLVQFGDWVSYYLAVINEVDPTPIAKIDLLKSRLAEL